MFRMLKKNFETFDVVYNTKKDTIQCVISKIPESCTDGSKLYLCSTPGETEKTVENGDNLRLAKLVSIKFMKKTKCLIVV